MNSSSKRDQTQQVFRLHDKEQFRQFPALSFQRKRIFFPQECRHIVQAQKPKRASCNYLALVTILNIVEPSGNTTRIVHATLSTRNEANRVICSQPEESEWPRRPVAFKLVTTLDVVGSSHTTISAKPSKSRANARASSMRAACLVGCLTDTGPRPRFARELRIGHSSCRSREAVVRRNGDSG